MSLSDDFQEHLVGRAIGLPWHWLLLTLALTVLGTLAGHAWEQRRGLAQLVAMSNERLELYGATLEAEVSRFAYLPRLLAIDEEVIHALSGPNDGSAHARASRKLSRLAGRTGASELFIVSTGGVLLATSRTPMAGEASDTGMLPDVGRAITEGSSGFFAFNPRQGSSDYFVVQAISAGGPVQGFAVVRINLAPLETTWANLGARSLSEKVLVVDNEQLALLSSEQAWRHRSLLWTDASAPGSPVQEHARPDRGLEPLRLQLRSDLPAGARTVNVYSEAGAPSLVRVLQETDVLSLGVRLMALSDPSEVWQQAQWAAWGGGSAGASLGVLVLYLSHRQRTLRQMAAVRDELEDLVDERTLQLQQANLQLQGQIAERIKAQDELIQASRLAALGQMSAEISHEINQPLTALRAMSKNTIRFFELGRTDAALENLNAIGGLVDRMERVARQLKSFVRKAPTGALQASLHDAVTSVTSMLAHRLNAEGVEVRIHADVRAQVEGDRDRLEQVLLNLCTNAIDAMAGCPVRTLSIATRSTARSWVVSVSDTGVGIDEEGMKRLFEPFYTTKPAGAGLGLGLVIAANIVREFGSTLHARRQEIGMVFEFELAPAYNGRSTHV